MGNFLIVSQDFLPDIGGTQTYAWELAARIGLSRKVTVIAPSRPGCQEVDAGAPFTIIRVPGGHNGFAAAAVPYLVRHIVSTRVDGALCIQWTAALALRLAQRMTQTRFPLGLAAHGRELLFSPFTNDAAVHAYDGIRSWALQGADRIFAVSRFTASLARDVGVPEDVIRVVPNGVDVSRFNPDLRTGARRRLGLDTEKLVLCVCRLVPRKGVDVLLQSMALIRERHPDVRLWVAGDGPERDALESLAQEIGLGSSVRFLGRVSPGALPDLFGAADLFAMVPRHVPPDVEGFGLVYLEASACGVPAIGARSGGIADAVLDGTTGILVEPGDISGTADALLSLLDDPAYAAQLGESGRSHAAGVATWDRVAETILLALDTQL